MEITLDMSNYTFHIGLGFSQEKDYLLATREAVQQARSNIETEDIDLAFLFTTFEYAHPKTLQTIKEFLGQTVIWGASSSAILTNQGVFNQGLAIMLLSNPSRIQFQTASVEDIVTDGLYKQGEELGNRMLLNFSAGKRDLGLVMASIPPEAIPNFLTGLQERLGKSFPLIGGIAACSAYFPKTHIYHKERISEVSAAGILLGGKLNFGFGVKHGWKPLGKTRQVTRAVKNIIYEIDGQSATNLYEDYFACDLKKLRKELPYISKFYPLGIYLTNEGDFLLRNIASFEENGSLVLYGDVPNNCQIRLMIGTQESCLEAASQAIQEAKKTLFPQEVKFAIIFDSISRQMLLGRNAIKEVEIIKEQIGPNVPFIGLYTQTELAPLKAITYRGEVYSHNQTIVVLAVGG